MGDGAGVVGGGAEAGVVLVGAGRGFNPGQLPKAIHAFSRSSRPAGAV